MHDELAGNDHDEEEHGLTSSHSVQPSLEVMTWCPD